MSEKVLYFFGGFTKNKMTIKFEFRISINDYLNIKHSLSSIKGKNVYVLREI